MKFKSDDKTRKEIFQALSMVTQIGLNMAIPIILCLFAGVWVDKWLGTAPIFLLVFIVLGVLAAFRNLYVMTMRFWK